MPLVAHNNLPTFRHLKQFGLEIMPLERAVHQDIRELHIGLLNMMPDAALTATEMQFINLVGNCNKIAQFFVYPFSLPGLNRGAEAREHIARHYSDFESLREQGLDALIITGANVANPSLDQEPFWDALMDVVQWAEYNVTSILCSCLATHAVVKHHHGIERRPLGRKLWGVYEHRVTWPEHPLVRDINTRFDAPHSRFNDVSREQMEGAGLVVLAESHEAGVHLAVSPDLFRIIYFQGHPEYDGHSLLKEYKREVLRYVAGELDAPPPFPENYFSPEAKEIAGDFLRSLEGGGNPASAADRFPEDELTMRVDNTWRDTGKAIVNNWLGLIYQLTSLDRGEPFMEGVDPRDPLGMHRSEHL